MNYRAYRRYGWMLTTVFILLSIGVVVVIAVDGTTAVLAVGLPMLLFGIAAARYAHPDFPYRRR